jgi:hypothetical protein
MLQHGLLAWCGFGANRDAARAPLAAAMERFYRLPFERFEPSSPYGTPAEVADALAPYVDAGAASLLLAPVTDDLEGSLAAVADVRERLRSAS